MNGDENIESDLEKGMGGDRDGTNTPKCRGNRKQDVDTTETSKQGETKGKENEDKFLESAQDGLETHIQREDGRIMNMKINANHLRNHQSGGLTQRKRKRKRATARRRNKKNEYPVLEHRRDWSLGAKETT